MVNIFVPGVPVAQGRPRFRTYQRGLYTAVQVYDPQESAGWKAYIRNCVRLRWIRQHDNMPHPPFYGPIALDLRFVLPRPQRLLKRVRHHIRKPDLDNLVKAVKDALGGQRARRRTKKRAAQPAVPGLLYANDSQVVTLTARKVYGTKVGVHIRVKEVEHEARGYASGRRACG